MGIVGQKGQEGGQSGGRTTGRAVRVESSEGMPVVAFRRWYGSKINRTSNIYCGKILSMSEFMLVDFHPTHK